MLVHLRLYFFGELLEVLPQSGDKPGIMLIEAATVHLSFLVASLEMQADVVKCGVGVGLGLRMIVLPKFPSCLHHGGGLGREGERGVRPRRFLRLAEKVGGGFCCGTIFSADIICHEMAGEFLLSAHFLFGEGKPMVRAAKSANAVLPVEKSIDKAVALEF